MLLFECPKVHLVDVDEALVAHSQLEVVGDKSSRLARSCAGNSDLTGETSRAASAASVVVVSTTTAVTSASLVVVGATRGEGIVSTASIVVIAS